MKYNGLSLDGNTYVGVIVPIPSADSHVIMEQTTDAKTGNVSFLVISPEFESEFFGIQKGNNFYESIEEIPMNLFNFFIGQLEIQKKGDPLDF